MAWISEFQRWLSEGESLNNAQEVINYFNGSDWDKASLAAMLGNMRHESSINPDMYEYGYAWEDDRGYGLVQWTPRSKYWDWATANGLEPRLGASQLGRITYEIANNIQYYPTTNYPETFSEFRANTYNKSLGYLVEAFCWNYERPNRTAGEDSMPSRKAFAERCYNELNWTGGGGSSPTPRANRRGPVAPVLKEYEYAKEGTLDNMTYYKVKPGDTLSKIANANGVRMDLIKRVQLKEIANANKIKEGEVLVLPTRKEVTTPSHATYIVKPGDTLTGIAKKFHKTVDAIANANGIKNKHFIKAGQKLKI